MRECVYFLFLIYVKTIACSSLEEKIHKTYVNDRVTRAFS